MDEKLRIMKFAYRKEGNMKKIIVWMTALALLLMPLTGCSKKDKNKTDENTQQETPNQDTQNHETDQPTEEELAAQQKEMEDAAIALIKKYKVYEIETIRGERQPKVLAKVMNREVTEDQLNLLLESYGLEGEQPADVKSNLLFNLTRSMMIFERAEELGINPTEEEVNKAVEEHKKAAETEGFVKRQDTEVAEAMGISMEEYYDFIRKDIRENLIFRKLQERFIKEYEGNPELAARAFNEYVNDLYRETEVEYFVEEDMIPVVPEKQEVPAPGSTESEDSQEDSTETETTDSEEEIEEK